MRLTIAQLSPALSLSFGDIAFIVIAVMSIVFVFYVLYKLFTLHFPTVSKATREEQRKLAELEAEVEHIRGYMKNEEAPAPAKAK